MTVHRGAVDKAMRAGAWDAFADEYDQLEAMYTEPFNVTTTDKAWEESLVFTGLATMPAKPELESVAMDRPMQVGSVKMVILSYGLGYEVSHEAQQDDQYNIIAGPSSRFLAASQRDAEERIAWGVFNNAFTTQEAYDGVALIHAEHPLQGGGTLGNRPASDQALSFTALQASVERFRKLTTERGLKIKMRGRHLWVPVELDWLANEILNSSQKPFTAENTTNVMAGGKVGLTAHSVEYLTSSTAWIVTSEKSKHKAYFFWREKPNMDDDYNKRSRATAFLNFSRFGVVTFDWRGFDGSTG